MPLNLPNGSFARQFWLVALELAFVLPFIYYARLLPYTKVEESFNVQAIHDISRYGAWPAGGPEALRRDYDHFQFPGVVPRTFLGAVVLSFFSSLKATVDTFLRKTVAMHGLGAQLRAREILGVTNYLFLWLYAQRIKRAFGEQTGIWFIILLGTQFHTISYSSRTLPNFLVFGICTEALSRFLPLPGSSSAKQYRLGLYLLTISAVIFRAEIAVLLAAHAFFYLVRGDITIRHEIVPAVLAGGLIGLAVTVYVDSYFWQTFPLWPEFTGFFYNAIQGKSVNWGISPWHYYFTGAIPRLLLNPFVSLVCLPLAVYLPATRRQSFRLLAPVVAFIAVYSILPHKEWRFVIYTIPSFTAVGALGANYIWVRRRRSWIYSILSLGLVLSVVFTVFLSAALTTISSLNYPGGIALQRLQKIADGSQPQIRVHMDNLSLTTGVTRFLQLTQPNTKSEWFYDKTEDEKTLLTPAFWHTFDYALAERPEKVIGAWQIVDAIPGFAGLRLAKEPISDLKNLTAGVWGEKVVHQWNKLGNQVGRRFTGGLWPEIVLQPRIAILRREEDSVLINSVGDAAKM